MRLAVSPGIERDQAESWRRLEQAEGLADLSTQPVLEKEREVRTFVAVMKSDAVVIKERH